jgi:hypothetical protein
LSIKSAGFLFLYTMLVGGLAVPAGIYLLDASNGDTSKWTFRIVVQLSEEGVMFGCMISVIMFLLFKFLLQMGWLPSRH